MEMQEYVAQACQSIIIYFIMCFCVEKWKRSPTQHDITERCMINEVIDLSSEHMKCIRSAVFVLLGMKTVIKSRNITVGLH